MFARGRVSRSDTESKGFLAAFLFLLAVPGSAYAFELAVESRVGKAGSVVELPVRFKAQSTPVAALVFEVEYDTSRLVFDTQTAKIRLGIPANVNHAADLFAPGQAAGRVGISIYDPAAPVSSLSDGNLVTIRFQVRPEAEGFAQVRVVGSPAPDAADSAGTKVAEWNPVAGRTGIFVSAEGARLSASPSSLSFGTVLTSVTGERELFLINSGPGTALIASISLQPEDVFSLAASFALPASIRGNGALRVPLRFRAGTKGRFNATLVVETADSERIEVPLHATVIDEGSSNHDVRFLIPAVAALPGAGGSRWRSSLAMINPTDQALSALISLRPTSGAPVIREIHLAGGASQTLDNVVSDLFGESQSSGALIINSSSPDLIIRSTTANENSDGSILGQAVPVIGWEEVFRTGQVAWLAGLEHTEGRQSSVALLNLADIAAALKVTVWRDDQILGERSYVLEPGQILVRIDALTALSAEGKNLNVRVEAVSENALFFAYASTMDRRTGAPLFQSPR